jgi:TatA/E family protein of Tat protein translocase
VTLLSPAKLLVVLVVAVIVLGPDKLPKLARQVGSLWGDFRRLRQRLETDVRGNFPDLPSTERITQAVRSPITFLDSLADTHAADNGANLPDGSVSGDSGTPDPGGGGGPVGVRSDPSGDEVVVPPDANRPLGTVRAAEEASIPGAWISDPQGTVHRVRANGRALPDDPSLN